MVCEYMNNDFVCQRIFENKINILVIFFIFSPRELYKIFLNEQRVEAIQNIDGTAVSFMRDFSAKHQVVLGGSFLCRLSDGSVRNRYQCYANGSLLGRHDKDLPTMWGNYFYEGGDSNDSGIIGTYDNTHIGAAVCWEFMRTMAARRLRNQGFLPAFAWHRQRLLGRRWYKRNVRRT